MRLYQVYTNESGETHFKDLEIDYVSEFFNGTDLRAEPIPATSMILRKTSADRGWDFHNAPGRQFCVNLDAGLEVTVNDGETRFVVRGEVLLLEDVTGKGHLSKQIENKLRHSIFITLPDQPRWPRAGE